MILCVSKQIMNVWHPNQKICHEKFLKNFILKELSLKMRFEHADEALILGVKMIFTRASKKFAIDFTTLSAVFESSIKISALLQ